MDEAYKSPFYGWSEDPDLHVPFDQDLHFFSPNLTALLGSKELALRLDETQKRSLEVHQLYSYLGFTVRLETEPVNEVAVLLSKPAFIPWLDPARRADALHVYRDEGKHADWSHQIIEDVVEHTGIHPLNVEPTFLAELDKMIDNEASSFGEFVKLFFVTVSETLITGSLNQLPRDESVQVAVRNIARAHARDEGRHHKYFKTLFAQIWPTMPYQVRVRVGTLLPSMLRAFLLPDRDYMTAVLRQYPEIVSEPERIVEEILSSAKTAESLRLSATPSLRMFKEAGVFDDPIISDAFLRNQFWLAEEETA